MSNLRKRLIFLSVALTAFALCHVTALPTSESAAAGKRSKTQLAFIARYEAAKYLISTGLLKEASSQIRKLKRDARTDEQEAMVEEAWASYYFARSEDVKAERHATLAIKKHPTFSVAFRTRALIRRQRGELAGAEEDFRSALSFNPADTKSLRGLAEIYLGQKREPEALSVLERYLEADPLDAWAQDAWTNQMAALLGYESFPFEYHNCGRSTAVTRAELAAVLVVGLELQQRKNPVADTGSVSGAHPDPRADINAGVDTVADTAALTNARSLIGTVPGSGTNTGTGRSMDAGTGVRADTKAGLPKALSEGAGGLGPRVTDCEARWFSPFVEKALETGLLTAYPDRTFRPYDPVRKGVLAVELYSFLRRTLNEEIELLTGEKGGPVPRQMSSTHRDVPGSGYTDVSTLSYLWRPVTVAVRLGILEPESESLFGADSTLSGQEALRAARGLARAVHSP